MHTQKNSRDWRLCAQNAVLAAHFKQRSGHDVEVGGHGRHQSAAVAGGQAECADDHGVSSLRNEKGHADAGRDNRKSGKAVAHDDSKQGHADTVDRYSGQAAARGDDAGNGR